MTATCHPASARRNRYRALLFAGCAAATLLTLSVGTELAAQSFQGNATVVSGSASVSTSPGRTDITPYSREAIINWTPFDRPSGAVTTDIDFQPMGTTANFMGGASGAPDFTVLNRVIPIDAAGNPVARRIVFNGTVNSTINGVQGGRVWFYSPTGIVIGSTATFNVGSLLLTTNDLQANGGTLDTGGSASFSGSGGSVVISPGATINAGQVGSASYVGVFSPHVEQRGTIDVHGQALLAAGEMGRIDFNAGLVDITIFGGTDDPNGIVHTGTTGGPASTGSSDIQQIKMIAVPKNAALTMLLSGAIGYTPAAIAAQDGSSVVLLAGDPNTDVDAFGNLTLSNATIRNRATIAAENLLLLEPTPGSQLSFGAETTLISAHRISLNAQAGASIVVDGGLTLSAGNLIDGGTISVVAGAAPGNASASQIRVTGGVSAYATGFGDSSADGRFGFNGTGGDVSFAANGGTLDFGSLFIDASGFGGFGYDLGGNGVGGSVSLSAGYGGRFASGSTQIRTNAQGGGGTTGGIARAGSIALTDTGQDVNQPGDIQGGLLALGAVSLYSGGIGGFGSVSGDAFGGDVSVSLTKRAHAWSSLLSVQDAVDGSGARDPIAGTFALNIAGPGSLGVAGDFTVSLDAMTGVDGPADSFAQGGTATIRVSGGGTLDVSGAIDVHANASVFPPFFGTAPTTSPDVRGGTISLLADGGSIRASDLALNANALGIGATTTAGQVSGGSAIAGARNGGLLSIQAQQRGNGNALISAQAGGGNGPQVANATGGTARLFASDGDVAIGGTTTVTAEALEGAYANLSGRGFNATGGTAAIDLAAGTLGTGTMTLAGPVVVSAEGYAGGVSGGGIAVRSNAGKGMGGDASVTVAAGAFKTGALEISATGFGGISGSSAGAPYTSGEGQGGTARFVLNGGRATMADLAIYASGEGGTAGPVAAGQVAAIAGKGSGGAASLVASGGSLDTPTITLDASGFGGAGANNGVGGPGGRGGDAAGGTATLAMPAGSTARVTALSGVAVFTDAVGGDGGGGNTPGNGGNAVAGTAAIGLADGGFSFGPTLVSAIGQGGAGSTIGRGTGGNARFALADTLSAPLAPRRLASLDLDVQGIDGAGNPDTGGATALTVTVGSPAAALTIAGDLTVRGDGAAGPAGNGFTGLIAGAPFAVGGRFTLVTPGAASLTIAPGASLDAAGPIDFLIGRGLVGSGRLTTAADASIVTATGIALTDLATGGTVLLRAPGGAVRVSNDLRAAGLVTVFGTSVDLVSLGALSFADADATAGNLAIKTAGSLDLTTVDATGSVTLASTGGAIHNTGAVNGVGIAYTAAGNVLSDAALASGGALSVTAGGTFAAPGASALGSVSLDAAGGMNLASVASGGTTLLRATAGTVTVNSLISPGAVTLLARSASVTSPGALTFTSAQATAGNLAITTAGNLASGPASATGALTLISTGGSVVAAAPVTSGGNAQIVGPGGVMLGQLGSGGTTLLRAVNGALGVASLTSAGPVTAQARSVDLASPGALAFASVTATAGALSVRTAGNLDLASASATGAATLTSTGGAIRSTGAVSGDTVTFTAAGAVTTEAAIAAANALTINAGGSYTAGGTTVGRTIAVGSSDVVLTPAARLGARATTQTIVLTNVSPGSRTFIGGANQQGAWSLSAAEALQLFADQRITIALPAAATAATALDFIVGQLALSYGANAQIGTGGELKLLTPGRVAVVGAVRLTTSSAADRFSIDPSRIDVIADTGSIAMRDASGALGGTLNLVGGTVFVGSQAALTDIAGLATDAITARLSIGDLSGLDGGWLQAGQLNLNATSGLFIQNSARGTGYVDRRGFSANGVAIITANADTRIVINGMTVVAGVPRFGPDTAATVLINGRPAAASGQFDRFSSINGCIIGLDCRGTNVAPGTSTISGSLAGLGTGSLALLLPLLEYRTLEPFDSPPLIDEPVTGVGNDDLWQPRCEQAKDSTGNGCPATNGD